jgi:hypothetical protein
MIIQVHALSTDKWSIKYLLRCLSSIVLQRSRVVLGFERWRNLVAEHSSGTYHRYKKTQSKINQDRDRDALIYSVGAIDMLY